MDLSKNMIVANKKIVTDSVNECIYDEKIGKWHITFNNGKTYSYLKQNIKWLKNPELLLPEKDNVYYNGKYLLNIEKIFKFCDCKNYYYHICYKDGTFQDYFDVDIEIQNIAHSSLNNKVFLYLKELSNISDIKNSVTNEKILPKQYEKIRNIDDDIILSKYLGITKNDTKKETYIPIFPFGCNSSQYQAVKNALESDISIIQGPPGTGKTQTILNIISNTLILGKTVLVVSSNNSAIYNILEKLSMPEYNLGFIVANLGKSENKRAFIEKQNNKYPDFISSNSYNNLNLEKIREKSLSLQEKFLLEEQAAILRQELSQVELEYKYFNEYYRGIKCESFDFKFKRSVNSQLFMDLLQEYLDIKEKNIKVSLWNKLINIFKYGIINWNFYKQDIDNIVAYIQKNFYEYKIEEIKKKLENIHKKLINNKDLLNEIIDESMLLLKNKLSIKYNFQKDRKIFTEDDIWKNPSALLEEYPVVLSTTFSSKSSLNNVVYDYIIIDEASQVDVVTGALALSCAKNAVIVGDIKQLPNVITNDARIISEQILKKHNIPISYSYNKSFLQSVIESIENVPQTLLKEHYRCHPKIINFCNQKFYDGQLVIMTYDNSEDDVLKVIKTVEGNHERDHYNQREIDVIKYEVIPKYVNYKNDIGIITPYRAQVNSILNDINDIEVDTVHKFQGREKDTIIISTVDDQISEFVDNPYLLNVAVSRAKKQLVIVVSGNKQKRDSNIDDLINYIKYNNFDIIDSKVFSVFDYLYKQNDISRKKYLKKYKRISEYDSENLMYTLILNILNEENYSELDVLCHFPLRMLIRNFEFLSVDEINYVKNYATHIDFFIYNKISKKAILAVEVDGYKYHKEGTVQSLRDNKKKNILSNYGIPLIKFATNGSGERELLLYKLKDCFKAMNN